MAQSSAAAATAPTGPIIGSIEQYVPGENFSQYRSRMDRFFEGNGVENDRRVSLAITLMGPTCYGVLASLMSPAQPESKSYRDIMNVLEEHFKPTKNEIAERYKFHMRDQKDGEPMHEYIVELKTLAETCNFGTFLETALRDKLVCGIRDSRLRIKLLTEQDLKWGKAQKMCMAEALTREEVKLM